MSCPRTLPRKKKKKNHEKNPEDLERLEPRAPRLRVKHLSTEPRGTFNTVEVEEIEMLVPVLGAVIVVAVEIEDICLSR